MKKIFTFSTIVALLFLMTLSLLCSPSVFAQEEETSPEGNPDVAAVDDGEKTAGESDGANDEVDHTVRILYSQGGTMKKNVAQVAAFIEQEFPSLKGRIGGDFYPIPPVLELMQRLLSALQMLGLAWMILGGENLWKMVAGRNRPLPQIYYTIQENKIPCVIFLFLLLPQIIGKVGSTAGALEILLDNELVFSKMATGRFPSEADLITPLIQAGIKRGK